MEKMAMMPTLNPDDSDDMGRACLIKFVHNLRRNFFLITRIIAWTISP